MTDRLKTIAIVAALIAGTSSVAMAQGYKETCPDGYAFVGGSCQPMATPGGVVAGAVGTAGAIAGGAVNAAGAIAGGAVNTAGAIAGGAVGAATGAPVCGPGYVLYNGGCYPAR
ncbi:MAG: hypothetical protein ACHQC9_08585 [Alphaproteobacteria bacterium]